MKSLFVFILGLYLSLYSINAQNRIRTVQYWFNEDFNSRLTSAVSPQTLLNYSISPNINALPLGVHAISYRFMDDHQVWSSITRSYFVKQINRLQSLNRIPAIEYWFNEAFNARIQVSLTPQNLQNISSNLSLSGVPNGINCFNIRYRDDYGLWSAVSRDYFVRANYGPSTIQRFRWWFNFDLATLNSKILSPALVRTQIQDSIDVSLLDTGRNIIQYQFMNSHGLWSVVQTDTFYKICSPPVITTPYTTLTSTVNNLTQIFILPSGGSRPYTYQWEYNDGNGWQPVLNSSNLQGATLDTLKILSTPMSMNSWIFRCQVTSGGNCSGHFAMGSDITLNVSLGCTAPTVSNASAILNVAFPAGTSLSVVAINGITPYTFQWQINTGSTWTNLSDNAQYTGCLTNTLSISSTTAGMNGYKYRCVVNSGNPCQSSFASSPQQTLIITNICNPVSVTASPASQTVIISGNVSFSVSAGGSSPFQYQWYKNSILIPGATLSNYTMSNVTLQDNGAIIRCSISNCAGQYTANSSNALLTVVSGCVPVGISTQPVSQTLSIGQTFSLQVVMSGTAPFQYQWHRNNAPISNATTSNYSISSVSSQDHQSVFFCKVKNCSGQDSIISSSATLTISSSPNPTAKLTGNVYNPIINEVGGNIVQPLLTGGVAYLYSNGGTSSIGSKSLNNGNFTFDVPPSGIYDVEIRYVLNGNTYKTRMNWVKPGTSAISLHITEGLIKNVLKYATDLKNLSCRSELVFNQSVVSAYNVSKMETFANTQFNIIETPGNVEIQHLQRLVLLERYMVKFHEFACKLSNETAMTSVELANLFNSMFRLRNACVQKEFIIRIVDKVFERGLDFMKQLMIAPIRNAYGSEGRNFNDFNYFIDIMFDLAKFGEISQSTFTNYVATGLSPEILTSCLYDRYIPRTSTIFNSNQTNILGGAFTGHIQGTVSDMNSQIYEANVDVSVDVARAASFRTKTNFQVLVEDINDVVKSTTCGVSLAGKILDNGLKIINVGALSTSFYYSIHGLNKTINRVNTSNTYILNRAQNSIKQSAVNNRVSDLQQLNILVEKYQELLLQVNQNLRQNPETAIHDLESLISISDSIQNAVSRELNYFKSAIPYLDMNDSIFFSLFANTIAHAPSLRFNHQFTSLVYLENPEDSVLAVLDTFVIRLDQAHLGMLEELGLMQFLASEIYTPAYISVQRTIPKQMNPGSVSEVILDVSNYGQGTARNVKLRLDGYDNLQFSTVEYQFDSIGYDQSIQLKLNVTVPELVDTFFRYSFFIEGDSILSETLGGVIYLREDSISVSEPISNAHFSVVPNPNNGKFTLHFKDMCKSQCNLTIYDVLGRPVFENTIQKKDSQEIDLYHLSPGVYQLNLWNGSPNFIKFVKY